MRIPRTAPAGAARRAPTPQPDRPRYPRRTFGSVAARTRRAAVLGALLLGVSACGGQAPPPSGDTEPTPPAATGSGVEPGALEQFIGNDLQYNEDRSFGLDISQLVQDPDAPGGQFLRTFYPEGSASRGVDDAPDGGMQAYLEMSEPADVVELTYQVRFPEGFEFVKGGKLPGLYGGEEHSGGDIPDGTNGLSTRYMWRADGQGEVYAYLPTSEDHGTSLGRGCWHFEPGTGWTTIRQRVQLNSPEDEDGRITVWQDDRVVLDRGGLQFRTTDDLQIEGMFFSTFFGGGDTSWASPSDQHLDFADFQLTEGSPAPTGQPTTSDDEDDCGTPTSS